MPLHNHKAFAVLYLTVIIMAAVFAVAIAIAVFTFGEQMMASETARSTKSYYASEAGVEDATYRVAKALAYPANYTLAVASSTATVTVTSSGSSRIVYSEGDHLTDARNLRAFLDITSVNPQFFYGAQVDAGGMVMGNGAQVNGNLFSNGSVTGGRVTGNATAATGLAASPSAEWPSGCTTTCGNADHLFATASTNVDIAQSFTAPAAGPLNKASVFLGKVGSPAADITMRITTDVSDHPNSSQIPNADATILRTSVGATPSWIDVTFGTSPALVSGTKYWIVLDYSTNSATNHWNWRKDSTDGYANNTGEYTSNWSSGSAVWTGVGGDLAFRLWVGGTNNQIANATVDGTARAPLFSDDTVAGSACPPTGPNCVIANDAPQTLPISDGVIQDFRNEAAAGGTVGSQTISGTVSLGPKKIAGDLSIDNGATLIVTGTLWVTGQFQTSNNTAVRLDSGYGANSGVIVGDGNIDISNNATLLGSGQAGSYIMIIAAKNASGSQVLDVSNNSTGAIFYAPHGRIHFNNNAGAKEVSGYGFDLDNNATITYESGLQNVHFVSGPGASFKVKSWKETERRLQNPQF